MRLFKIRPRWKKVFRDLWGNKSRTMLVVSSIAVGILAVGIVSGSQQTVARVLNQSYMATNPPSGQTRSPFDFEDKLIETIGSMREIELAEGRRQISLRYKLKPTDEWKLLNLQAADNFAKSKISKVESVAGKWPPPDKKLVIERSALKVMGAKIGDIVTVERSDGKLREMEIVGTSYDLNGPPAAMSNQFSAYISRDTLEWLGETRNFNQLLFIVSQNKMDQAHIEAVGEIIIKKFETEGLIIMGVRVQPPGEHPVNSVLEPLMLILTSLGGLSVVLSGFLVINTVSAMLAQQTRQIGMMKAIGGRRGQIMELYFVTVFIYGFLAVALAMPLGALGAYALTLFLLNFFNTDLDYFAIPPTVLALQAGLGLLIPLLVAVYPIMKGTSITVREAVSDYGVGKGKFGTNVIDRLLGQLQGLSRPLLISLRNTFRRKSRLTLTLLTLTLAGMTFITIFTLRASMLTTVDDLITSFGFDMMVIFQKDYRMEQIERAVAQMPIITGAENWGRGTVNRIYADDTKGDDVTMEAPPADTKMYKPDVLEGRWLQPDDTTALVVNTDFIKDEPDLKVGSEVIFELNSKKTTWQIVGLIQGTLESSVYVNQTYFGRLTHNVDKARMVRFTLNKNMPTPTTQVLEEQFKQAGLEPERLMTVAQMQSMIRATFNFLIGFMVAMALVMAAVGGLGLSGTMSINVLERVREIGVMRAIGASDGAILRLVLIEGVTIGLLSWLAGSILAWPISWTLNNVIGISLLSKPLSYKFSIGGLEIWLGVTIVLAIFASYFPAHNASQLTVREVLAYE